MRDYFETIKSIALFKGIEETELNSMLKCIEAEIRDAKKDEIILLAGDKPLHVGIVISGQLHVLREDYDGNRLMLAAIGPGEIFAEALCCAGVLESPVTVRADEDSVVMLVRFSRILSICPNSCSYHKKLIENMLRLIAGKNLQMQGRMEIVGLKSVRARVMRYLESMALKHGRKFTIPFNREEMADFLCVERTALSHELGKMKKDGLIEYKKNDFILK